MRAEYCAMVLSVCYIYRKYKFKRKIYNKRLMIISNKSNLLNNVYINNVYIKQFDIVK